MTTKLYGATAVNGGGTGAMDSIHYAILADGDICFVIDSSEYFHVFRWESSETTPESTPDWTTSKVVQPEDVGSNDGAWVLVDAAFDDLIVYGDLSVAGDLTLSGSFTPSSFTAGGDISLADSVNIILSDVAPASDHSTTGILAAHTAGEGLVFGDFCYLKLDGKYWKADADDIATMPITAMAAESIDADASGNFLMWGYARDDTWNWTVGGIIYGSTTAGAANQSQPSGDADIVQALGIATHADRMFFNPDLNVIKVSA